MVIVLVGANVWDWECGELLNKGLRLHGKDHVIPWYGTGSVLPRPTSTWFMSIHTSTAVTDRMMIEKLAFYHPTSWFSSLMIHAVVLIHSPSSVITHPSDCVISMQCPQQPISLFNAHHRSRPYTLANSAPCTDVYSIRWKKWPAIWAGEYSLWARLERYEDTCQGRATLAAVAGIVRTRCSSWAPRGRRSVVFGAVCPRFLLQSWARSPSVQPWREQRSIQNR